MKKFILAIATSAVLLVGCQEEEAVDTLDNGVVPQEVVVEVLTAEEQQPGETVTLQAKVTQGEEDVDDATMEFEVWESGFREEGVMIDASLTEEGVYEAQHTFAHDGVYYMYAHTNARGMHVMPKQEVIVGTPDMTKVVEDSSSESMNDMPQHEGTGHEQDSNSHQHQ